ncbi:Rrf2 family transcriptional regulator [Niabella terrae]
MFSKTCEYAIRAMIYIAHKSEKGNKINIKEVAEGIGSPEHFIAKILQQLSRKELVLSVKGPNGGFYHDVESLKHSLADVVRAVDGEKIFSECGLGLKKCSEAHPCPIHHKFKKIRKDMNTMLEKSRLSDFKDIPESEIQYLKF